jgi:FtsH-binding integral membrane protein
MTGAAIYSLWRSKTLLVFTWYRWIGLQGLILTLRAHAASARHLVPDLVLYSAPDALWVYSFTFIMQVIWLREPASPGRAVWTLLPLLLSVGAEFGQLAKIVPGTFDIMDIVAYLIAWAAATGLIAALNRRNRNEVKA